MDKDVRDEMLCRDIGYLEGAIELLKKIKLSDLSYNIRYLEGMRDGRKVEYFYKPGWEVKPHTVGPAIGLGR